MRFYGRLQRAGAHAWPRVGFVEKADAERFAGWVNSNEQVGGVVLDLMTYGPASFDRTIGLLAHFDQLTGERQHYLVDGVCSQHRIEQLYLATNPRRVTISEATMARCMPRGADRSFSARASVITERCAEARRAVVDLEATPTIEGFIDEVISPIAAERSEINTL